MKNIQLLIKLLSIFWGIVLFSITIKSLVDYLPKKNWDLTFHKQADTKRSLTSSETNISDIDIPHPKKLYTFNCDSNRSCEITANSYVLNRDGIDFIPDDDFVIKCLMHYTQSKYCRNMIHIGDTKYTTFDSEDMMKSFIKSTIQNPEYANDLKEWQQKKLKKAKAKVMSSL